MTATDEREAGATTQAEGSEVALPLVLVYLVLDESASMAGDRIDRINANLPELHGLLREHPAVSDGARLGVIVFSDDAATLLDPSDAGTLTSLPGVQAHGNTNYGRAFAHVRSSIERDVAAFKADGHKVYRPAVVFMSDGVPNVPGWEAEHGRLVDKDWALHANVVAFGVGEADPDVIRQVGNSGAFIQSEYTSAADALSSMFNQLVQSIIDSAQGSGGFQPTTNVTGFDSLV